MTKVFIGKTESKGRGLFAKADIKKYERIFSFNGKKTKASYDSNYTIGSRWLGIGRFTWLAVSSKNPGYYINHSCKPNVGLKGVLTVVAMRNIKKGEEITIDYSTTEEDPYWKMVCRCGEKKCRKTIRSIQFIPRKSFRKYKEFIPKFFQRAYLKHAGKSPKPL